MVNSLDGRLIHFYLHWYTVANYQDRWEICAVDVFSSQDCSHWYNVQTMDFSMRILRFESGTTHQICTSDLQLVCCWFGCRLPPFIRAALCVPVSVSNTSLFSFLGAVFQSVLEKSTLYKLHHRFPLNGTRFTRLNLRGVVAMWPYR